MSRFTNSSGAFIVHPYRRTCSAVNPRETPHEHDTLTTGCRCRTFSTNQRLAFVLCPYMATRERYKEFLGGEDYVAPVLISRALTHVCAYTCKIFKKWCETFFFHIGFWAENLSTKKKTNKMPKDLHKIDENLRIPMESRNCFAASGVRVCACRERGNWTRARALAHTNPSERLLASSPSFSFSPVVRVVSSNIQQQPSARPKKKNKIKFDRW